MRHNTKKKGASMIWFKVTGITLMAFAIAVAGYGTGYKDAADRSHKNFDEVMGMANECVEIGKKLKERVSDLEEASQTCTEILVDVAREKAMKCAGAGVEI